MTERTLIMIQWSVSRLVVGIVSLYCGTGESVSPKYRVALIGQGWCP